MFNLCCSVPRVTVLINELTSATNTSLDKGKISQLVALINSDPKENGKTAAKAFVAKLDDWNPLTQLLTLMTLEAAMKECTLSFFDVLAARNIPQMLSTLAIRHSANEDVQVKAEELLQEFALTVLLDDSVASSVDLPAAVILAEAGTKKSLPKGRMPTASFASAAKTGRAKDGNGEGKLWERCDRGMTGDASLL